MIGLDEMDEEKLLEELSNRRALRSEGRCDYCRRLYSESSCRFPERHNAAFIAADDAEMFLASLEKSITADERRLASSEKWLQKRQKTPDEKLCPCDAHPDCETCDLSCSCHWKEDGNA